MQEEIHKTCLKKVLQVNIEIAAGRYTVLTIPTAYVFRLLKRKINFHLFVVQLFCFVFL